MMINSFNHLPFSECNVNQYRCSHGACIDAAMECDGKVNCYDGSDEGHCRGESGNLKSEHMARMGLNKGNTIACPCFDINIHIYLK